MFCKAKHIMIVLHFQTNCLLISCLLVICFEFCLIMFRPVGGSAVWRRSPHQKFARRERERQKEEKRGKKERREEKEKRGDKRKGEESKRERCIMGVKPPWNIKKIFKRHSKRGGEKEQRKDRRRDKKRLGKI